MRAGVYEVLHRPQFFFLFCLYFYIHAHMCVYITFLLTEKKKRKRKKNCLLLFLSALFYLTLPCALLIIDAVLPLFLVNFVLFDQPKYDVPFDFIYILFKWSFFFFMPPWNVKGKRNRWRASLLYYFDGQSNRGKKQNKTSHERRTTKKLSVTFFFFVFATPLCLEWRQ